MARAPRSKPIETKSAAIYEIKNLIDNKVYIGSAKNYYVRKLKHLNYLKHGKHHCKHLQFAWNKYEEANFEFHVLEILDDISKLAEREQYWMDLTKCYDCDFEYNILPMARTSLGSKRTPEQRLKIAASQKGIKRSDQAIENMAACKRGKTHTAQAKENMSIAGKNRSPWNCPDGSRCKCDECLPLRRIERRKASKRYYEKTKKLKQGSQIF